MRSVVSAAIIGSVGFLHVDGSSAVVVVGAAIFLVATWRRDSREVLRRQNADLAERNTTLEADNTRLDSRVRALEERPDVAKIYDLLGQHDQHSRERDELELATLQGIADSIRVNTEAMRLWATHRAGEF